MKYLLRRDTSVLDHRAMNQYLPLSFWVEEGLGSQSKGFLGGVVNGEGISEDVQAYAGDGGSESGGG